MSVGDDFLIAYGSQTGQAESIAKQLKEKTEQLGLKPRLYTLDDNEKQFHIEKEKFIVIIVSSTGDGDAPENAARFVRRISRRTLEANFLHGLNYALLGLGDSNYSTFQGVPKKIDKQLKMLGATSVMETGEADDQVGLELVVEPWIEKLYQVLVQRFSLDITLLSKLVSKVSFIPKACIDEEKDESNGSMKPQDETMVNEPISTIPILEAHPFVYPDVSIIKGNDKLSADENLRVPIASQPFLTSAVSHEKLSSEHDIPWQNACKMVGIVSKPYVVTVVGVALVTDSDVAKPKREIIIDLDEHISELPYEPGDAFYFITPNPINEVNYLLQRMGVLSLADQKCTVSVDPTTQKINASIPGHIPPNCSLRYLFTYCLDIRRSPGRPLLRVLADNASNPSEHRRLLELCSAQGMNEFTLFIRQAGLSIADVLFAFPSVQPPVDRLIELLPRLIPRPYSVASSRGKRVRFVYSLKNFSAEEGRRYPRKGFASEWLSNLHVGDKIQVMRKEPARFRLPPPPAPTSSACQIPLLMVGPGTGVAVFLAFCQHLLNKKLAEPENFHSVRRYLFFGCRNLEKDALYKDELESYVREGILTELILCESQGDGKRPKYVQDALKQKAKEVCDFLLLSEGPNPSRIFICGDAKGMSKDVWQCFHDIIKDGMNMSTEEVTKYMLDLKKTDRYVEDVWA